MLLVRMRSLLGAMVEIELKKICDNLMKRSQKRRTDGKNKSPLGLLLRSKRMLDLLQKLVNRKKYKKKNLTIKVLKDKWLLINFTGQASLILCSSVFLEF